MIGGCDSTPSTRRPLLLFFSFSVACARIRVTTPHLAMKSPDMGYSVRGGGQMWATQSLRTESALWLGREVEVVGDAEDSGGSVGLHQGDIGVARTVDESEELDVSVLHDDVDGVKSGGRGVG